MKTIAFFVPQYHRIPLNDKYWGEGFTEWDNIRNVKPEFEGHNQPRVPLNNNYYNLLDRDTKAWQIELAKKYGLYGFCYYHYWFDGKMLLEKPCEQILEDKTLDFPFCFCWANEAWSMQWTGEKKVIMPQKYGREESWKRHFEYLLPFFEDDRYIKEAGKPIFVIYRPEAIECLNDMIDYWQKLALVHGLPGIVIMSQSPYFLLDKSFDKSRIDYEIEYQPGVANKLLNQNEHKLLKKVRHRVLDVLEKKFSIDLSGYGQNIRKKMENNQFPSYDDTWNKIISRKVDDDKLIPGAFTDWDNSPRYHERAQVYMGATPEKFGKYFSQLIRKAKKEYKKNYIFIFAWNEWGEGGYLEPDTLNKYGYLENMYNALKANDALEDNNG